MHIVRWILVILPLLLCSCVGTSARFERYSGPPESELMFIDKYNNFLHLGPCGMKWNYDNIYIFQLNGKNGKIDSSGFKVETSFPIVDKTGYVEIDRKKKIIKIDVQFIKKAAKNEIVTEKCEVNGEYRYKKYDFSGKGYELNPKEVR